MTVMAVEKAGQTAASRAAGRKAVQGRVTSSTYDTYNTRSRARSQPSAPASQRARQTTDDIARARAAYGRQARYVGGNAAVPGSRGYQPVLLAEFLAAAVIITAAPIATGGSDTAKAKGGISPYDTGDLRQLVAVGAVYFVLALASSGNSGRLSAWLGGLVLLAIAMGKLAHGNLSAVFNAVTPDKGLGKQTGDTAAGAV